MSGPYDIPDDADLQCDVCDKYTTVTEWTNPAKGWFYDDWTCDHCGAPHTGMSGSLRELGDDHGATTIAGSLILFGCALVIIAALIQSLPLFTVGATLAIGLLTVATINYIRRNHS